MIFFYKNRFAIDLGYSSFINTEFDMEVLVRSASVQLLVEMIVDVVSAQVEHKAGLPPSDYFFQFRNVEVIMMHIVAYIGQAEL